MRLNFAMFNRFIARTIMSTASKPSPYKAQLVSIEPLEQGKWIQTRKINYKDPKGADRVWEMAVRTTRTTTTNTDAVSILANLKYGNNKPNEVVLTKQFRPPCGKVVIELPAGLIDPKESVESTAVRELIEETGYHGQFVKLSLSDMELYSDPGLTNANMALAVVDVDMTKPENINPKPELEDGEFIECFNLPLTNLMNDLIKVCEQEGCVIDARLYHYAAGIEMAKTIM